MMPPAAEEKRRCPRVIAIILNTNRRADTLCCLDSLRKNTYPDISAIVLDNDSSDGSAEAVSEAYPDVDILHLSRNLGYAGNNNIGIRAALARGAEWILILNEDTILDPDCVLRMAEAAERDPRTGIVGPMVYHYEEPDVIQSAGGRLGPRWQSVHLGQNEPDRGQFAAPHEVDWISGCAIMVRREVIEQVGGIDERYFYYWEETEWCLRAGKKGWKVIHVPQAKLWHKGVRREYRPAPHVTYYGVRNRLLTLSKHQAPLWVRTAVWIELLRTLASWTVRPKWRAMRAHRDALWKGMVDFISGRWGPMY
jgi:hypothetical protein